MIFVNQDFKTIQIALTSIDYDDQHQAVYRFLLPKLLSTQTDQLNSKIKFNTHLEELYGAYFRSKVERIGQYSAMTITMTIANPKIIDDANLLDLSLNLFNNVLYDHQTFDQKLFEEEKRLLIEQWESLYDKKRYYANHKFSEMFYGDDPEGYPISGTLEDILALNIHKMNDYYHQTFLNQQMMIVVCGQLDENEKKVFSRYFEQQPFKLPNPIKLSFREAREKHQIEEVTTMKQAIIKMGYIMPVFRGDQAYAPAILLDTILGGYPESMLFKEIREKEGLCYDIASSYHAYKGTLTIGLGVDSGKRILALEKIEALIDEIKNQGFNQTELNYAKSYVTHQLKMSLDNQSVLTKRALLNVLFDENKGIDQRICEIEKVTLKQINALVKKLVLDTVYILHGGAE